VIELLTAGLLILFSAYFSFKAGKNSSKVKEQEGLLDVIKQAREVRDDLSDPSDVDELLREYKDR